MEIPFFYIENDTPSQTLIELDQQTSKHIVQVLRKKNGDVIHLTDGNGHLLTCKITSANKKNCTVTVSDKIVQDKQAKPVTVAISLLKNVNRFEWFVEKATEMGVSEIIPLQCERTEKKTFRMERIKGICVSAMLQSQQCWLPQIGAPVQFKKFLHNDYKEYEKLIAHCVDTNEKKPLHYYTSTTSKIVIAIGPEGDFSPAEIALAGQHDFVAVSLGSTRLRTETAGVKAVALLS